MDGSSTTATMRRTSVTVTRSPSGAQTKPKGPERSRQRQRRTGYNEGTIKARLADLFEWEQAQNQGWNPVNHTYRMWQSPGVTGTRPGHRILHETVPPRLREVNEALSVQARMGQKALRLRYGWMRHAETGQLVTNKDRAAAMGISERSWNRLASRALEQLLSTMNNPPGWLTAKARAWD